MIIPEMIDVQSCLNSSEGSAGPQDWLPSCKRHRLTYEDISQVSHLAEVGSVQARSGKHETGLADLALQELSRLSPHSNLGLTKWLQGPP